MKQNETMKDLFKECDSYKKTNEHLSPDYVKDLLVTAYKAGKDARKQEMLDFLDA